MKPSKLPGLIAGAAALALSGFVAFVNLSSKPLAAAPSAPPAASAAGPAMGAAGSAANASAASTAANSPGGAPAGRPPQAGGPQGNPQAGNSSPGAAPEAAGRRGSGAPIIVDAARAELGSLAAVAKLTGEVQAVRSLRAYPDTAGRLIETVPAGTRVQAGDVVARVDPSRPGSRFEPSPVRAPLSGSVVSVLIEAGANVTASSAVVEIATLSELDVVVRVPERWAADVPVGAAAEVTLTAFPGRRFPARVRSADPTIDPVSRSKRVLLRLSGDISRLEPGMFAEVSLVLSRSSSALVIPLEAVVRRGGSDFVYVVESGAARERPVRIGLFSETGAEVLSGLTRGEVVVVRGQNLIRDGSRVSVAKENR